MPNANILQHKHDLEGFTVESKTAIALGASVSGVIDLEGYQLAAFYMPAAWEPHHYFMHQRTVFCLYEK